MFFYDERRLFGIVHISILSIISMIRKSLIVRLVKQFMVES